ncbi:MAG: ImmA/IrrE family metallo-endopeptidase [Clostridia bacterium]|nr:ImmA/IrrE family metallo-endopeptidase [Clostridia bacterium]
MDYKVYQKSRDFAWKILLREGVRELPVDVVALCRKLGVRVVWYDGAREGVGDGFSVMINGKPRICIERGKPVGRTRFTIAHELGHVLLGHVGQYHLVNREPSSADNAVEQAANTFAARLLAPACVLWGCGVRSAAEIATLCGVSDVAAGYRWARMQILLERGKFCTSPIERLVYHKFSEFILNYRRRQGR